MGSKRSAVRVKTGKRCLSVVRPPLTKAPEPRQCDWSARGAAGSGK
jgi:hypothetical protein